jgi:hypothetical protein
MASNYIGKSPVDVAESGADFGPEFALHGLDRDADGLLSYTKILWDGTDAVTVNFNGGFAFNGLEDMMSGVLPSGTLINTLQDGYKEGAADAAGDDAVTAAPKAHETNAEFRAYQQVRFDKNALTYFINGDGMLVARYNGPAYDYSGGAA